MVLRVVRCLTCMRVTRLHRFLWRSRARTVQRIQTHSSSDLSVQTHLLNVNISQQQLSGAVYQRRGLLLLSSPSLLFLSLCVSLTQTNYPAWILQSQAGSEDADVRGYSSVLTRFEWFSTVRLMRGAAGPRHWSAETTKHQTPFQNKSLSWLLRTSAQNNAQWERSVSTKKSCSHKKTWQISNCICWAVQGQWWKNSKWSAHFDSSAALNMSCLIQLIPFYIVLPC